MSPLNNRPEISMRNRLNERMNFMEQNEKQRIHSLFESKNYIGLYQTQAAVINEMLMIEDLNEFEDFLENEDFLDENIFWLYYSVIQGESLLIGAYEEDVSEKAEKFFQQRLPENIFDTVKEHLYNLYVDFDTKDNIEEITGICNKCLAGTGYSIKLRYENTYCEGAYFLSIISL